MATSSQECTVNIVKRSDILPSMVTHTQNLCSAINPSKVHTQSSEHTHKHTTGTFLPFMLRRLWSSWGFGALLKGTSVTVLRVERALYIHSPHLQFLPDLRFEPATFQLRVRLSNPLGHDFLFPFIYSREVR